MNTRILVSAIAGIAVSANVASAQICQGDLSFRGSSKHVGGAVAFSDNATSFGGGMTFGRSQGWYSGASIGMVNYNNVAGNSIAVGGGLGYAMPLQAKSKWQVCPGGTLTLGFGPTVGGVRTASQSASLGASFGTALALNKTANLLPFGSVGLGYTRVSASGNGASASATDTYLLLGAGAGFQLTPSLVLRPALSLAAGADLRDDTIFSFGVTWALPR